MDFLKDFSHEYITEFRKYAIRRHFKSGRELTLYNIDKDESCVLTSLSMINAFPFPANALIDKDAE